MLLTRVASTLLLLTIPLAEAAAQDGGRPPGNIAARAFTAAPAPLAFTIQPGDNTDENMALAERLGKEASARGMTVRPDTGALILRFDTEVRTSAPTQRQSFSRPGGAFADPDSGTPSPPGTGDEVTNLLSTQGDGVINRRALSGDSYARVLRYVINAMLDDPATGRRLWQGHVSYDTADSDRTAMFVALAPVLAEQIGKAVPERSFRLD